MTCPSCGKELALDLTFCFECGASIAAPEAPEVIDESVMPETPDEPEEPAPQGVSLGKALKKAAKARVGTLSCGLQGHTWNGCMCTTCEAKRSKGHEFQRRPGACEQICATCGKIEEKHDMQAEPGTCKQKCTACGKIEEDHNFREVPGRCLKQCLLCGHMEKMDCDYDDKHRCIRCGEKEKRSLLHLIPKDATELIGRAFDVVEKVIDKKN